MLEILEGRVDGTVKKYEGELRHIYKGLDTIVPFESPLRWLQQQWPQVVKHVEAQDPQRCHFQFAMLSGILKNREPGLYAQAHQLLKKHPGKEPSAQLTEKEKANWLDFKDYKKVAKQFDQRVAKLKGPLKGTEDVTLLYQQLMLCMTSDMPPLRNEPSLMRVVSPAEVATAGDINLLECLPDGKYMLHLRKYKTAGRYGEVVLDLPPKVERSIARSLRLLPRPWLLSSLRDVHKPMGTVGMSTTFATILPDKRLSSSLARKIYLSHMFRNDEWEKREKLARRMQHSAATAGAHYQKTM